MAAASPEARTEAIAISDDAVLDGFHAAIITGGVVALLGALIAFRLPKKKITPKGHGVERIVRDSVRNTTVVKL